MNIKDNIDKEVLSAVAKSINVTEDLLIQMISSDLTNKTIAILSVASVVAIIGIALGLIAYFQDKKTNYDLSFGLGMASTVILICSIGVFAFSGAYSNQFEVLFNHEYAVVKEINLIYDEMKNPQEEVNQ